MEPTAAATPAAPPPAAAPPSPPRAPLGRRRFLTVAGGAAAVAGVGAVALPRLLAWRHDPVLSQRAPLAPASQTVLVTVFLQGGNDGLATVIPVADGRYRDARPGLAAAADAALPIDGGLGLNPKLTRLKELWDRRHLAVVENVGYDQPNLSHFASTDIWMTCDTKGSTLSGWVGRYLDAAEADGHDPLRAVALGPSVPRYLRGERAAAAAVVGTVARPVALLDGANGRVIGALAGSDGGSVQDAAYRANIRDLLAVRSALAEHAATADHAPAGSAPAGPGQGQLAGQLLDVATLIRTGLSTRVYGVSVGGFDTHAAEEGSHDDLMSELDAAVGGFFDALAGSPYAKQVVLLTSSEFGRRVAENGSGGTDHGAASVLFVAGSPVKGGVYGGPPDLADLDTNGDLKASIDFRSVYSEVTERVLDGDPVATVGKGFSPVGFLVR